MIVLAYVYFDETEMQEHIDICKDIINDSSSATLDAIDSQMSNCVCRSGYISGTSRDETYTVTTGLSNLTDFAMAKTSGGTVGLMSYGFINGGTGSGFGNGNEDNDATATLPTGTVTVSGGNITIVGTNRYSLQGTYRWVAKGSL